MSLPRIKFHLVVKASSRGVVAACGLKGIPRSAMESFAPQGSHFIGQVPASVGRAFNGLSELAWHHDNAPSGMCGTCYAKWQCDPEIGTEIVADAGVARSI